MLITKTFSIKETQIGECSFVAFEAQRQVVDLHMAHPTSQNHSNSLRKIKMCFLKMKKKLFGDNSSNNFHFVD